MNQADKAMNQLVANLLTSPPAYSSSDREVASDVKEALNAVARKHGLKLSGSIGSSNSDSVVDISMTICDGSNPERNLAVIEN